MNFRAVKLFFCAIVLGVLVARIPAAREFILHPVDMRPIASVLLVGDARMEQSHITDMVNAIADSAHSAKKYKITLYILNSTGMEDLWNDPRIHGVLGQKWDYVVLQGPGGEQLAREGAASFATYGQAVTGLAQSSGSVVTLFIGWQYTNAGLDPQIQYMVQDSYGKLAIRSGVQIANVGSAWDKLHAQAPQMTLYQTLNRPSVYAGYLEALMLYRCLSGDTMRNVTYVPEGLTDQNADLIRRVVQEY